MKWACRCDGEGSVAVFAEAREVHNRVQEQRGTCLSRHSRGWSNTRCSHCGCRRRGVLRQNECNSLAFQPIAVESTNRIDPLPWGAYVRLSGNAAGSSRTV